MEKHEIQIGGRKLTASFKNLAEQANGSVMLRYGDTVVLATVTMSDEDKKDELGYFPLMVFYEEKFYAAGKIGGSRYTRREGKPSDRATLISRMIDRSIRPLFPANLKKEVEVIVTCLSWDEENDPAVLGGIASSIALSISDVPWNGPISMVRVGREDGELILNPTYDEREEGDVEAVYSGFFNDGKYIVNMVESFFEEAPNEEVINSVKLAKKATKKLEKFQQEIIEEHGEEKIKLEEEEEVSKQIKDFVEKFEKEIEKVIFADDKEKLDEIKKEIKDKFEENAEKAIDYLDDFKKELVRKNILKNNKRPDGRKEDEVRELSTEVKLLPRTHGTGLFSRGKTRSLSIITLGPPGDKKLFDNMEAEGKKRFMHHYNFPPYSVGETWPLRGPKRREIGHGMLGEKAIRPVLPDIDDFPYTIRSVSEIMSSNGSTSQAAMTSTSLALMDAGVPIKAPVTGISIGMVSSDDDYRLLTDIQGLEDHAGDMDFKVAGTRNGVNAIQMDVKVLGITIDIMEEALERAEKTRHTILDKMEEAIEGPREELSPYAPRILTMKIDKDKIREVIGPGGKVINEIIDETEVSIDIEDSGDIFITSEDKQSAEKAYEWIKNIVREPEKGEMFKGKVKKIMNFGCFVEIMPGTEGLVHISELSDGHVDKVEDVVSVGDVIPVKVLKVANDGKIDLSLIKAKKELKKRRDAKNK
ncbi:MAG: polyribonucleotide nucleotidyltransferase [Patescibacteria group bacterium]